MAPQSWSIFEKKNGSQKQGERNTKNLLILQQETRNLKSLRDQTMHNSGVLIGLQEAKNRMEIHYNLTSIQPLEFCWVKTSQTRF